MDKLEYRFVVEADDQAAAGRAGQMLSDMLREVAGVLEVDRQKADEATMDLGAIVTAIATSGATLAIAQGISAWLRARKGASLTIEHNGNTRSIKAVVSGIDAEAAVRITEIVRGRR